MMHSAALCALLLPVLAQAQYQLVKEYNGEHFFDTWNFYNNSAFKQAHPGSIITLISITVDNLTNGDVL